MTGTAAIPVADELAASFGGRLLRFGAPAERAERDHDSPDAAGVGVGGSSPLVRLR